VEYYQEMAARVLIVGTGLLGTGLYREFSKRGVNSLITTRNGKFAGIDCNELTDYQKVIDDFRPTLIVNTIPQPSKDLLELLLSARDCFKVDFSSPAADFARMAPEKCPPGSYPGDKLTNERIVNQRGSTHNDALALQIGFIPEISSIGGKPVMSGLSFDTMVMCNLLTGQYVADLNRLDEIDPVTNQPILASALQKYDTTKGFTCTPVDNIFKLLFDLVRGVIKIPKNIFGRTVAMHSSQVWPRSEIVRSSTDENYTKSGNPLPNFYGQKSEDKITKPVREFLESFGKMGPYAVTQSDVINAITTTSKLFTDPANREQMIRAVLQSTKKALEKERLAKPKV
jgi:hypothetical protein